MKSTTDFDTFFAEIDSSDAEEMNFLRETVSSKSSFGYFDCKVSNNGISISCSTSEYALFLTDKAQPVFLKYLEDHFDGDRELGIEATAEFNRQMEKDD